MIRNRTPLKSLNYGKPPYIMTPDSSLSKELKKVLNERNLLTTKTRKKVCSMLDNLTPEQKNEFDKRKVLRLQAIREIYTSEQSYIKQLEILMNYFVIPLKNKAIIDTASHTTLFGQIEMIYNLNGELLSELEKDLENVASAFIRLAPFFKLYSVYAFDYKNALLILQDLISKNPVFRKFLEVTESRPEVQKKLNALMITPIQRVPRYRLLLQQVLLYTSPVDHDFKMIQGSVREVESTVSHINSVIEDQEVTQMLLNLQNSLLNRTPNIVKPSRKIIKEGVLNKVTRNGTEIKRYCILMSDIFMYCKILKDRSKNTLVENSLQCCCIFPLKKCKVYELFPGNFKIACQGDGIILCTTDYHVGQMWVASVRAAIELHIQCRKTLRKESSKRTPIRKKDVKNFDVDYILSPNKRKYDYESVFRCSGNSDSDNEDNVSCFNLKSKILKRKCPDSSIPSTKTSESDKKHLTSTPLGSDVTFKIPYTPPRRVPKISTGNKSSLSSTASQQNIYPNYESEEIRSEDSDPTYGFANRFSETKSYFRTHNVDSTIPASLKQEDTESLDENMMDVLYPLRSTTGSVSSSDSSWLHKREEEIAFKTLQNTNDLGTTTVPRKRVKFEDTEFENEKLRNTRTGGTRYERGHKPVPYRFPNELPSNRNSLRQRIVDFFARLF